MSHLKRKAIKTIYLEDHRNVKRGQEVDIYVREKDVLLFYGPWWSVPFEYFFNKTEVKLIEQLKTK